MPQFEFNLDTEQDDMLTDILIDVNKSKADKDKLTVQQWMVNILGDYVVTLVTAERKWKATKMIGDAVYKIDLELKLSSSVDTLVEELDDITIRKSLRVGSLMLDGLKRALAWYNALQKQVFNTELRFDTLVSFVKYLVVSKIIEEYKKIELEALKEDKQEEDKQQDKKEDKQ